MNKKLFLILIVGILLAGVLAVYAITFTADATQSVTVPTAALATICQVDETGECTDRRGEILFGNAIIENFVGDRYGLFLVQFGDLYIAKGNSVVYNYRVTTTDGRVVETTNTLEVEGEIESIERLEVVGITGTFSKVLSDGNEVTTTGDTVTYSDEKGSLTSDEPLGEFLVTYNGLVLENYVECGEYQNLVNGEAVKGVSTRECTNTNNLMVAGEYETLELTFNQHGSSRDRYKLVSIDAITSFEWEPTDRNGGNLAS